MSFELIWYDEAETILHAYPDGDWVWQDFFDLLEQGRELVVARDYRIDVILDFGAGIKLPTPQVLAHVRRAWPGRPLNHGVTIVIGAGTFVQSLVDVFMTVMGDRDRFAFTDNLAEALTVLDKARDNAET